MKMIAASILFVSLGFIKWWLIPVAAFLIMVYSLARIAGENNDDMMTDEYYNEDESFRC